MIYLAIVDWQIAYLSGVELVCESCLLLIKEAWHWQTIPRLILRNSLLFSLSWLRTKQQVDLTLRHLYSK
jgi:hypothetical protein